MNLHPDYLLNEVNEPSDIKDMSLDELKQSSKKEITIYLNSVCIFGGVDVK